MLLHIRAPARISRCSPYTPHHCPSNTIHAPSTPHPPLIGVRHWPPTPTPTPEGYTLTPDDPHPLAPPPHQSTTGRCTTPWPPFTPNPPLPSVPRRERQGVRKGVPRVVLVLLAHVILASGEQNNPGGAVSVELWRGGVEIERIEVGLGSRAKLG